MSSVPSPVLEVEEGSPMGGDSCEDDDSHVNQCPVENDETDHNDGNLFPFDNLSVEFYEEPEEDGDSSNTRVSEHQDAENDETTDIQESQLTIASCDNSQGSSLHVEGIYSDNSKSNMEESENQDTDEQVLDVESYESNDLLKDNPNDTDYKELQKTCIESFIYPSVSGVASFDETSNSASDEIKGSPLSRFPRIVKAVENADYENLQILYQLLYQRKAWDTQEILIHRILEFSGFTFNQNSEDYFNSEMMLRTLPDNVLVKIGGILCPDLMKNLPTDLSKVRPDMISNIMEFLCKPRKRARIPKLGDEANKVTSPNSVSKCGCRSRCLKKFTLKEQEKLLDYMNIIKEKKLLDSYILSLLAIRKITRKCTEETKKIREISYQYKVRAGKKEALVCKGAFCILHGIKLGKVNQIQNKLKSGKNVPPEIQSEDFPKFEYEAPEIGEEAAKVKESNGKSQKSPTKTPTKSPSAASKKKAPGTPQTHKLGEKVLNHLSIKKVPKVVVEKIDLNSLSVKKDIKINEVDSANEKNNKSILKDIASDSPGKSSESPKEIKNEPSEQESDSPKKLRDFSLVLKCIENAPEELLIDVHFLLFLTSADANKIKDNVLNFSGFSFNSDTEEYDERNEFLLRMSNKIVTDVARSFSLAVLNSKEDTIKNILSFLSKPDESYLRTYGSVPVILSDAELDDIEMSDSDESITCEVVEKKVECIDLISSGDESDKEEKGKKEKQNVSQVPKSSPKPAVEQQVVAPDPTIQAVNNSEVSTDTPAAPLPSGKRTLRNFETICKIVNTHPHEYLVDIYDLLYMKKHDPNSLRSDILDFSGFTFEKGSSEYIKRKQLLDRMLYNSVRRIYNTLIHNTTEIKVFSKPTMITEIFQFLFKLPDHDTSIRPPPSTRPLNKPMFNRNTPAKNTSGLAVPSSGPPLPNQTGKLSDLKRVFQRVACFPCEYLIDVHKLLFMTDCDPKVIRQNIFGFKGFSFGTDSPEFQQRKMYLEYLTFHSLRKISSVLTTRSVDLRNSTKHELATHLTQVLAEYTNTFVETEPLGTSEANSQADQNSVATTTAPSDPNVENIVVTPIIDTLQTSPSSTSIESQISTSASNVSETLSQTTGSQNEVSSTSTSKPTISNKTTENPPALAISIVDTRSISQLPVSSTSGSRSRRKRKSTVVRIAPDKKTVSQTDTSQFADINLPEIEQYRQIYGQNLNLYSPNMPAITGITTFSGSGVVPQSFPHLVPQTLPFPVVHTYSQPLQVQSPFQPVQQTSQVLGIQSLSPAAMLTQVSNKPNEVVVPGECTPNDGSSEETVAKKLKTKNNSGDKNEKLPSKKLCLSPDEALSLQSKLRDVMNTEDDEEDCDKPLASLIGHPIDSVLRKQICDIVEQTDLQDITINGVIQKIYNMYPKFDLSYRKEFIKSTLRSILYKLGEQKNSEPIESRKSNSPDCSVSTTDIRDSSMPDSAEATVESR